MGSSRSPIVLLVEPDTGLSDTFVRLLNQRGCYCFDVWDARNAICFFAQEHAYIDFVLLDENLPDCSSRDCLLGLRNIRSTVPIYLMVSPTSDIEEEAAVECTGLLMKPIDIETLDRIVQELGADAPEGIVPESSCV